MRWSVFLPLPALVVALCGIASADQTRIQDYGKARSIFWSQLYPQGGEELYCGESFTGRSEALNIEHAFPASWMARHLGCGGRSACRRTSARFNRMEADLHNLFPSVARINSARGNFPFGEIPGESRPFPGCDVEIERRGQSGIAEPRPAVRGNLARAILYMQAEYGMPADPGMQPALLEWHRLDPPSAEERARNQAIERLQGTRNAFVDNPTQVPLAGGGAARVPDGFKLATWNIGWLTDRAADITEEMRVRNELRRPIYQRTAADFHRLRVYADLLDADVVALQEIDGIETARKLFDPARYDIVLTEEADYQRPGFAIRKGVRYRNNGDLVALDVAADRARSLRRGADVTVETPAGPVRLLSVHLKSGCFSPRQQGGDACRDLDRQIPILDAWIDARQREGTPFVVLGDFNRRFAVGDPLWRLLDDGPAPLLRPTEGQRSACWGGQYPEFIDHVVIDGRLSNVYVPGSFDVLVFRETDRRFQNRLSDHCPVSVLLAGPS